MIKGNSLFLINVTRGVTVFVLNLTDSGQHYVFGQNYVNFI
jgi:hypothetical protein